MPDKRSKAHAGKTRLDSERFRLRHELRKKRRELSPDQQKLAAENLLRHASQLSVFQNSRTLSFYTAADGEIDPLPLLELAHQLGKKCYLPVLATDGSKTLIFASHTPGATLNRNYFGLMEPTVEADNTIAAHDLDLVFLPLVGFDKAANRLGMGGGYYDRTFSFLLEKSPGKPRLIGLGHDIQGVESLEVAAWDIPLDGVVTDLAFYPAGHND